MWTGSQNWSDRALNGDEVTMHIPRRGAFYEYRKNFDSIWSNRSKWIAETRLKPAAVDQRRTRGGTINALADPLVTSTAGRSVRRGRQREPVGPSTPTRAGRTACTVPADATSS